MNNLALNLGKVFAFIQSVLLNAYTYLIIFAVCFTVFVFLGVNIVFGQGVGFIVLGCISFFFMIALAKGIRG